MGPAWRCGISDFWRWRGEMRGFKRGYKGLIKGGGFGALYPVAG